MVAAIVELLGEASREHAVATRSETWVLAKLEAEQAVLALDSSQEMLLGFGSLQVWESGHFVSHSGLVVAREARGLGLGRALKASLMELTREAHPHAAVMGLTQSAAIQRLNLSFGYRFAELEELTSEQEFWNGCLGCQHFEAAQATGRRCCSQAMLLESRDLAVD